MRQIFKVSKRISPTSPPAQDTTFSPPTIAGQPPSYSTTKPSGNGEPGPPRRESQRSNISDIQGQLFAPERPTSHQRSRSQDRRDDPLGLTVLYEPEPPLERSVDIVFVHGLGGTSLRTWCRNRDLENLWPELWLPKEDGFESSRIITYGYNAHFSSTKEHASLALGDFANDLLFRMRYGEHGNQRFGQVPIVFVVHSMGGLVFKKAFIQGLLNSDFHDMISMVKAVLFLATPHRGTDLAETLNRILTNSIFGHSPKDYVAELARRSPTIDELNESFRHHASKLQVFSFYETLSTSIGLVSAMILDKNTAVLGYPGETPQPMIANHHDICKFKSKDDPNYGAILGALRSAVGVAVSRIQGGASEEDLKTVKDALGVSGPPEDDLAVARSVRKEGTCEHFLQSQEFAEWKKSASPMVLWAHAQPGNGKSTLCAFTIERLIDEGHMCAYYFFKFGHREKKSVSGLLRSIAYQMALGIPAARRELADQTRSGVNLQKADASATWKLLFLSALAHLKTDRKIFWVIDGLDESESSRKVVELLSEVEGFQSQIRVLIFSRPQPTIHQAMQKARKRINVIEIALLNSNDDIRLAVSEDIEYLPSDDDFKRKTVDEIIQRSQGNFLWASLVAKQVVHCHRQDQMRRVLESTPDGMDHLYERMIEVIASLDIAEDVALSRILLSWAIYAKTPLTVEELSTPYQRELSSLIDLKHTVHHVCGQFVVIDTHNKVTLVHQSAREYLRKQVHLPFSLEPKKTHEDLLGKCLVAICDRDLRNNLASLKIPQFLNYAATSWAYHLENCSVQSDRILNGMVHFFNGPYVLSWIQYMAMSNHLTDLPGISRRLSAYVAKRSKWDAERPPMLHRLSDLAGLETWATDLLKITAKFGRKLSEDPTLIFRCIPSLSPSSSAISQRMDSKLSASLSVAGISNEDWDDCLVRVSGSGGKALRLDTSPQFLAVASEAPKGSVTLWSTSLFQEHTTFNMKQRISDIRFNKSGSLFACCGISRTCIWRVEDRSVVMETNNPFQERAVGLSFDEKETLYMVTDIRRVYKLESTPDIGRKSAATWKQLSSELLAETDLLPGVWLGTPQSVAFNSDCSAIAIAYRSLRPTVWNVNPPRVVARLKKRTVPGQGSSDTYTGGEGKVVWHPSNTQILGIDDEVFKWTPLDDLYETIDGESGTIPNDIQCSPNGLVFITGDVDGTIKIYEVSSMSLIYKLSSEDGINRICFSSDSLRFFDLRGAYCNVWEPNCLARVADASSELFKDEASTSDSFWSDTDDTRSTSISFPASESLAQNKPRVIALAPRVNGRLVAFSNSDGSMEIYDVANDKRHELDKSNYGSFEHLEWCDKQNLLAQSELYGAVTVLKITNNVANRSELIAEKIYHENRSPHERGTTLQLLFDNAGGLLLIYGTTKTQIISIATGDIVAEDNSTSGETARWAVYPSMPFYLIYLTLDSATIYDWALKKQHQLSISGLRHSTRGTCTVDAVLRSHCQGRLLLRTITIDKNQRWYGFVVLKIDKLQLNGNDSSIQTGSIEVTQPAPTVLDAARYPVGLLSDGCMVFIDDAFWVCTAHLEQGKSIKRHFFIPRDWVTSEGARICQVLRDGMFYCPTKGRVAVITSNLVV